MMNQVSVRRGTAANNGTDTFTKKKQKKAHAHAKDLILMFKSQQSRNEWVFIHIWPPFVTNSDRTDATVSRSTGLSCTFIFGARIGRKPNLRTSTYEHYGDNAAKSKTAGAPRAMIRPTQKEFPDSLNLKWKLKK